MSTIVLIAGMLFVLGVSFIAFQGGSALGGLYEDLGLGDGRVTVGNQWIVATARERSVLGKEARILGTGSIDQCRAGEDQVRRRPARLALRYSEAENSTPRSSTRSASGSCCK